MFPRRTLITSSTRSAMTNIVHEPVSQPKTPAMTSDPHRYEVFNLLRAFTIPLSLFVVDWNPRG